MQSIAAAAQIPWYGTLNRIQWKMRCSNIGAARGHDPKTFPGLDPGWFQIQSLELSQLSRYGVHASRREREVGTAFDSLAPKGRGWGEGVTMLPYRTAGAPSSLLLPIGEKESNAMRLSPICRWLSRGACPSVFRGQGDLKKVEE
jgi:hypothetical protein